MSSLYKDSVGTKSGQGGGGVGVPSMLRPSFPGGVPYPPRPGEPGVRYAVFPPGSGAGAPPPASSYSRDPASVYGRQVSVKFPSRRLKSIFHSLWDLLLCLILLS